MAKNKFTVKVEGLRELETALKELPKATSRNVLSRTLRAAAQPIADRGESLAPVGATGKLADSYSVSIKLNKRQRKLNKKESPVEIYVGPTQHAKSVQTEFGNAHQSAHPHLRPAWDAEMKPTLERIRVELAQQIEKARQRLARKAAREAAKLRV